MENNNNKKSGLLSIIGKKGIIILIATLIFLGVLLMLFGEKSNSLQFNSSHNDTDRLKAYEVALEEKISALCSKVNGVSNVSVSVYLDSGFETVYAYDEENKISSSGTDSEKKYVTIGSGNEESMVSIVERTPNIRGIAIVCTGGGKAVVAKEITNLLSSAFGIKSNCIYVAEGKK